MLDKSGSATRMLDKSGAERLREEEGEKKNSTDRTVRKIDMEDMHLKNVGLVNQHI